MAEALGVLLWVTLAALPAHADAQYQVLRSFGSTTNDGVTPSCTLVEGRDGALYGTTVRGGTNQSGSGHGTVFKLNKDGSDYTVLYSFDSSNQMGDGGLQPGPGVVQGSDGALYGATSRFSSTSNGTVFKLNTDGSGYALLYAFLGSGDGANPEASLIQGSDGSLYGTTWQGGTGVCRAGSGFGTVFKISMDGSGYGVLHSFGSGCVGDGANPAASLVEGSDGALYGTTWYSGAYATNQSSVEGYGTVFKLNKDGSGYSVLYSLGGSARDGGQPVVVMEGSDGTLYGTTGNGGSSDEGTVFKLNKDGSGYDILHSFSTNGLDGVGPYAGLVEGRDGVLYGMTVSGGSNNVGTVFNLNRDGTGYRMLHSFGTNGVDGQRPVAGLLQGSDGAFYGTTRYGGENNKGTVFSLSLPIAPPQLTIIPSGANVILTWPTNATGFTLQSTTNLGSSAVWTTNSPAPVVVNGQNTVTNPISGAQQFYRLIQ